MKWDFFLGPNWGCKEWSTPNQSQCIHSLSQHLFSGREYETDFILYPLLVCLQTTENVCNSFTKSWDRKGILERWPGYVNLTKVIFRGCTGAPNDRMFPDMPEMSHMVFSMLFEAFLVSLELPQKLFLCSDVLGNFGRHESFRWLFCLTWKC